MSIQASTRVLLERDRLPRTAIARVGLALLDQRAAQLALILGLARLGADQLGEDRLGPGGFAQVQQDVAALRWPAALLGIELGRLSSASQRLGLAATAGGRRRRGCSRVRRRAG